MRFTRDIGWNVFFKRMFALVIDTLLFITVLTVLIRIFNFFIPGSDVREDAMQLYTEKDFNVFVATSICALVLLAIYMLLSYRSATGQTLGHRAARIRIVRRSGGNKGLAWVLRRVSVAWFRLFLLLAPGPFVAWSGGSLIFSIFALIWGSLLILPLPISKSSKSTLWEQLGDYQFVKKEG